MTLSAGTRLGPYEILGLVGAGGMGEVYRARDPRLGRDVAIKVLPSDVVTDPERLQRFEREARAVAALNHPNVLTVFDVGTHDGTPYVVTELLEGETLRELLSRRSPNQRQILSFAAQTARGLDAAHAKGIVHRDLKPENVFVTTDGRAKVLDFGLAKLVDRLASDSQEATEASPTGAGQVLGTVGYMSPEQVRGLPMDHRTDLFSLGVVLYELLSGKHPFRRDTTVATLTAILEETPADLSTLARGVPPALSGIVARCLEKDRGQRFRSAYDLALSLEAVLQAPAGAASLQEVEEKSPYPGLMSFTEKDAALFFGRESEIRTLWERLGSRRLLAIIGPSGAGKTSFLRAGVIPARPEGWGAACATPGASPAFGLARALTPEMAGDPEGISEMLGGVADLVQKGDGDRVVSAARRWRGRYAEALLVLDQFEELFTQSPPETQERFAALLARLCSEADIHVALSLRDDFLMRCHEQPALVPVFTELTPLGALTKEGLRSALVEPAKKRGYGFEDEALVAEMVESVEGARSALPLLAFAVSRLWEKRDRERKRLTRAAYEEIGGVAGALAQHAEATLDRIGGTREPIVREIFRNLVTSHGTRAVAEREELLSLFPERKTAEEVLRELVDARLLTSYEVASAEGGTGAKADAGPEGAAGADGLQTKERHRVEIVHESLLKAWPRLVRWQTQDEEGAQLRDQLKQAAHLWEEKSRSPDLLWSGTSFREYELWRERYQGKLTALEEEFAKAMVERARRRRRLRRGAVAAAFLVLAGVSAAIAVSRHQATKARDEARAEALHAEANRLVTLGQLRLADDPTEALAYATASLELADTSEARVFAMKALWEAPPSFTLPVGPPPQRAPAFSPDGTKLAAGGHDPVELLWNESGGAPISLDGNEISPRGQNIAGWSADGHLVTGLCCTLATRVHVWSAEGKRLRTIEFGAPTRWQVGKEHVFGETEEGPPGRRALLLRSWRLRDGEPNVLDRVPGSILGPSAPSAFLPDATGWAHARGSALFVRPLLAGAGGRDRLVGRHGADIDRLWVDKRTWSRVLSHDKSGETRVWTLTPGKLDLARVIPPPATVPPTVFGGERRWVFGYPWFDKRERLWDLEALPGSRPLELRRSGSWYLAGPSLHPKDDWLTVSQYLEGRAVFWPLRKRYPSVVDGYTEIARPVTFSPDGRWLATNWSDKKLRLWPMPGTGPREPKTLELPETVLWESIVFDPRGRYLFGVGNSDRAWIVPLDGSHPRRLPVYSEDTLLWAGAVSPSGRRVATAWNYGLGPKTLRLHDVDTGETRVFRLPTEGASSSVTDAAFQGAVLGMGFFDETTLYTSGWAGLRRWDLERGTCELVSADVDFIGFLGPDRRLALTGAPVPGREAQKCRQLQTRDLVSGKTRAVGPPGVCVVLPAAVSGDIAAAPGSDGVLVGRLSGDTAHLLVGHEGPVTGVALSPDGRWVATSGEDNTLRLWPTPDLAEPPLHALPHDELVAKLKSLTNLRVVRDPKSPAGWRLDVGPFPGWKDVPTW
jgi:eukaryotic-like serine/threonine-protein kinase